MQTMTSPSSLVQIVKSLPRRLLETLPQSASASSDINCSQCRGIENCGYTDHRGYRPISTERGTALAECPRLTEWKAAKRLSRLQASSGIPELYRRLDLRDFKQTPQNLEAFIAATELTSLYISGAAGSGKTMLLSLIGSEHIKRGRRVLYTTAIEMTLKLRYNVDDCEQRLEYLQTVDVLLLDDLGSERRSEYTEEQLQMVIDGRLGSGGITAIASTCRLSALKGRYNTNLHEKIKRLSEREAQM